jgi:hypothetical protein
MFALKTVQVVSSENVAFIWQESVTCPRNDDIGLHLLRSSLGHSSLINMEDKFFII